MDLYLNLAEPHEICGEDNYGNMIWKRTPAGDFAAVPCPPDATGKRQISFLHNSPQLAIYRGSFELFG